jgi:hypothetical protein
MSALVPIEATWLESMMQIAEDTRKRFIFVKDTGTWSWGDKNEEYETYHTGFTSFYAALEDAVEPYLEEDEDE